MQISLTIAIPTMRRWSFLKDSVPDYLARPEVAEVVICDETGEDYDALMEAFGKHPKLRLFKNEKRLGIYENKKKVLGLATNTWVALLDSDNIFGDDWFEALAYMDFSDPKRIFASADFKSVNMKTGVSTRECRAFRGLVLDPRTWNETLEQPKWNFLLNDGNWIVPRSVIECLPDVPSESLQAADAIFMARCFVKGGYTIYYVPGLEYTHLVHPGSSWLQTDLQSSRILLSTDWRI
jgi:hypothetical protein